MAIEQILKKIEKEAQRIEDYTCGEHAPPVEVCVIAQVGAHAHTSLSRVREVMRLVLVAEQHDHRTWPADSWWSSHLPKWFCEPFQGRTVDEVMRNPHLWDFGSWLDAMKDPGWEWWSSEATAGGWIIRLRALSDPYSIGPFEYLARAAGADRVEVREG